MKYLVLGSAGQVGAPLCEYLVSQGHTVQTFDVVHDSEQDLRLANNARLDYAMSQCDFVFFLAWDVGGSRYLAQYQDTISFIQNNVKIMSTVFDALTKHQKPFVFASSQMSQMGFSTYGITKALAERATAALNGITVKFWNVYGPEHSPDRAHVITDFVHKAKTQGEIRMLTTGQESRQMLHATDCAGCLYELSQRYHDLPRDQEYHVTSFEWITIRDVANTVAAKFSGTKVTAAETLDTVQQGYRFEPDPFVLNFWKPTMSLSQGIDDIIQRMETV
jgi:nucleoside-diphosphate-sugar epimerase